MIFPIVICVGLIALLAYLLRIQDSERRAWEKERCSLLQRIQAPEIAVYENARESREAPPRVGFEDDEAFMAAHRQRELRDNGSS